MVSQIRIARRSLNSGFKWFPRNEAQREAKECIGRFSVLFLLGPPGTGKTHTAAGIALERISSGKADTVILTRPTVSFGKGIGFLPGAEDDKMHRWIMPFGDVLRSLFRDEDTPDGRATAEKRADQALMVFQVMPLDSCQGRTLDYCVACLDEAQNCTFDELHAYMTRIGKEGILIISGDPNQSIIGNGQMLIDVATKAQEKGYAKVITYTRDMILRSPIIAAIEETFEELR